MKISEIISYLDQLAPFSLQESYDNSGLIVGNPDNEVSGILVCLDVDRIAMELAVDNGCQLILSHHPFVFKAIKRFTCETREGDLIVRAIKENIGIIGMHTNFDSALGGLSDLLCRRIGLEQVSVLKKTSRENQEHGSGRKGLTGFPMSGEAFVKKLAKDLSLGTVRLIGNLPASILKVAVYNGAYDRDILSELASFKPDVLVTGDLKYHDAQELMQNGIFAIDAGHFGTEKIFVEEMAGLIEKRFPSITVCRYEGEDIFTYYSG